MARQREDPRRTAREQVGAFLSAHRGLVSPQQAGLPSGIGHRRVQGLRREEVALQAGISVEYYAKLERGAIGDVSPQVVDALARVLQLSTAEREHLDRLVHTSSGWVAPDVASRTQVVVRPELQRVLDLLEPAAAFVRNGRLDVLATNAPEERSTRTSWLVGRLIGHPTWRANCSVTSARTTPTPTGICWLTTPWAPAAAN